MSNALLYPYMWVSYRRELTCDRVDVDQAIAQWNKHRHEVYVRYRTVYSTHPPLLWRFEEITKSAWAMGLLRQPATAAPAGTFEAPPPVG